MTTPASGVISIQDIINEFGGSPPNSLSQYYRGASGNTGFLIQAHDTNATNVPTSGVISLNNFYSLTRKARVSSTVPGGGASVSGSFANNDTVPLWTGSGGYDFPGPPAGGGALTVSGNTGGPTISWVHVLLTGTANSTVYPNETSYTGIQFRNQTIVPPSGSGHLSKAATDRWTATVTVDGVAFIFVFNLSWSWEIDY